MQNAYHSAREPFNIQNTKRSSPERTRSPARVSVFTSPVRYLPPPSAIYLPWGGNHVTMDWRASNVTLTSHLMRHSLYTHMDAPATTHTHAQTDAPSPLAHTHTHTHTRTHITRRRERERELEERERERERERSPQKSLLLPPRPHPSKPTRTPDTHAHARSALCRAPRFPARTVAPR